MATMLSGLMQGAKAVSTRLIAAYIIDWILLVVLGVISYAFSRITPHFHAFSVLDLSISYPKIEGTVSLQALAGACVLAPAAIMAILVFALVPGPSAWKRMSKGEILRIKLWEFNAAWLGMALAQATQFLVVQGLKTVIGKPRPHMLDVCQPDLDNLSKYVVGGHGQDISPRWVMVDWHICQQDNWERLKNAFESFPSGHSSTSWAGMLYFSLWLAAKLRAFVPVVPYHKQKLMQSYPESKAPCDLINGHESPYRDYRVISYRDEAAGPPIWALFICYIPLGVAFYTSGTRYFNYYHHGFDIIVGSLVGIIAAWIGFRWYHPSLSRSTGWAWSPRSRDRAFAIGVGSLSYVTDPVEASKPSPQSGLQLQPDDEAGRYAASGSLEQGHAR